MYIIIPRPQAFPYNSEKQEGMGRSIYAPDLTHHIHRAALEVVYWYVLQNTAELLSSNFVAFTDYCKSIVRPGDEANSD